MNKPMKVGDAILTPQVVESLEDIQKNPNISLSFLNNIRNRLIELSFGNEELNLMTHMREIQVLEDQIKQLANLDIAGYE